MKIEYVMLDDNLKWEDVQEAVMILPQERREKILRYRFEKDKLLSLAAGLLIRRAVGESSLRIGEHGKPYAENGVYFSVSHSGRMVAIATDILEIGLDTEKVSDESRLKIAERFYHPCERAVVFSSANQRRAFCKIWTLKEAYLKMTGEGITTDMTAFDTTAPPLSDQLYTASVGDYCLSVCSKEPIGNRRIQISKIELKDLLT